jgi:phosphatidate cytidylyltransferase
MAAIVDTALPLAHDKAAEQKRSGTLRRRIASALVLAPVAIGAVWLGSPFLPALILCAGAVMGWEWARLCGRSRIGIGGAVIIVAIVAGVLAAATGAPQVALVMLLLGSATVFVLERAGGEPLLAACGILWIGLPCIALVWLSQDAHGGRMNVLWILAVVWATDIGAYAVGRTVGGPRLAPRISPSKTWSGLLGGVVCATAAGAAFALATDAPVFSPVPLLSGVLAIVAQSGDLAESIAKRHFGVKDSSSLIPGHGGLLDRLDGMLTVIPAVALLNLVGGGSVVAWR